MENVKDLVSMVVPVDWLFSVLPAAVTEHALKMDILYWFLIWTCLILLLLVVVPLGIYIVKYRRKRPEQKALSQNDHNFWLESSWTFMPLIYLTILFIWGFVQFVELSVAPIDSKVLRVIGQKWQWSVDYPQEEINVAGQGMIMAVPVGKPVKLIMSSQDVIHSFFIPNARVKMDVLPGRYTNLWFQIDQVGKYPILCAEYCGDDHSRMLAELHVLSEEDYEAWVESQKATGQELPLPELGKKLYTKLGCAACHTTDGSVKIGPSFKGLYGRKEQLTTGATIVVSDDYIKEHILQPQKNVVKGFPPVMPSFQGRVSERDILGLIAFIKSFSM